MNYFTRLIQQTGLHLAQPLARPAALLPTADAAGDAASVADVVELEQVIEQPIPVSGQPPPPPMPVHVGETALAEPLAVSSPPSQPPPAIEAPSSLATGMDETASAPTQASAPATATPSVAETITVRERDAGLHTLRQVIEWVAAGPPPAQAPADVSSRHGAAIEHGQNNLKKSAVANSDATPALSKPDRQELFAEQRLVPEQPPVPAPDPIPMITKVTQPEQTAVAPVPHREVEEIVQVSIGRIQVHVEAPTATTAVTMSPAAAPKPAPPQPTPSVAGGNSRLRRRFLRL